MNDSKLIFRFALILMLFTLNSCLINNYTADRAEMIGKNEIELCAGGSASLAFLDDSFGGGLTFRYGVNSLVTLGLGGDVNLNGQGVDWASPIYYSKFAFEQKFALFPDQVSDVFALKLKQGIAFNNYTGQALENPVSGDFELITPTKLFPFGGAELLFTIPHRFNKNWSTTFMLRGLYGQSRYNQIYTYGVGMGFERFTPGPNRSFLGGFEMGLTGFYVDGREEIGVQIGLHFSLFKDLNRYSF